MAMLPRVLLAMMIAIASQWGLASATALTFRVASNEAECFYTSAGKLGEKIAFYFAVQEGGQFDIDFTVRDPRGQLVAEGRKERQRDIVFSAELPGDYEFCFSNEMSTVSDKLVDFEIALQNEQRAGLPLKPGQPQAKTSEIEESLIKLAGQVTSVARSQKYFRTRENRNLATVRSTESRIYWFSILGSALMVALSAAQVMIVRTFFTRRTAVKV